MSPAPLIIVSDRLSEEDPHPPRVFSCNVSGYDYNGKETSLRGPKAPDPEKTPNTGRFQGSKKMERERRGFGVWVITCGRDATHRFPPIPEIEQCAIPGSHQIYPRQRGNLEKDLAEV